MGIKTFSVFFTLLMMMGCGPLRQPALYALNVEKDRLDIQKIIADNPLAPGEALKKVDLGRTSSSSQHLIIVLTNELLHVHEHHDGEAVIIEGKGNLFAAEKKISLKKGDVVVLPQGLPHYFENTHSKPTIIFVTFSPPYDDLDHLIVQSPTKEFLQ